MPSRKKTRQRSVAIQSTEITDAELEPRSRPTKLCKKEGFRNLLRKSVTVVPQEDDGRSEGVEVPGSKISRSVQASLDGDRGLIRYQLSADPSFSGSRPSEMMKIIERPTTSANPGTSKMTSTAMSSISQMSQVNEPYRRPQEGSLAVVYNYGDLTTPHSRSSNLYYYGSQGSRRFSDETVLLIEDYQSYDYLNAAGRQDTEQTNHGRRFTLCCGKKNRRSTDPLTRPLPISVDFTEDDDNGVVCRICHEGERFEPLLQPCLCKGSVGCVHARCLKTWLEQSNTSRCELCNYPYAIRQNKKYSKCFSIRVFFGTVVDKRSLVYDAISFVVITPLTIVGVAMCIQASVYSTTTEDTGDSNFQMGNITRAGMIMLSVTIIVAYGVWLYTLISYHFKTWRKWYSNCYDVEILPVKMTSAERLEASQRLNQERSRRQMSRERNSASVVILRSPHSNSYTYYPRAVSVSEGAG